MHSRATTVAGHTDALSHTRCDSSTDTWPRLFPNGVLYVVPASTRRDRPIARHKTDAPPLKLNNAWDGSNATFKYVYSVGTVAAVTTLALHDPCHSVKRSKFLGNRNFLRTLLPANWMMGNIKEGEARKKKEKNETTRKCLAVVIVTRDGWYRYYRVGHRYP